MKSSNNNVRSIQSSKKSAGAATAVWLESKEFSDATTQLRECMMRKFMESRSRPEIRMIEQTIVCLQELEQQGNLTSGQKAQLDSLLYEHAQMLVQPKKESTIISAA